MNIKRAPYYLLLTIIFTAFLYLSIKGIGWGLPGKERSDIVLPQELRNAEFYNLMIKKRNDIYALANQSPTGWMPGKMDNGVTSIMKSIGINSGQVFNFNGSIDVLADFVRPYLLRSNHPDEQMTLTSLAGMKPRQLDFNPRQFVYGGAHIYPLGAWLAVLNKAKMIVLAGDMTYYFDKPDEMAKIFIAGRCFSVLFGFMSLLMIYIIGLKYFNERTALIASLLYSVMPAIIFQMHIMKPYPISMFFSLVALYYSFGMFDNPEKCGNYIMSGIFSGFAAGSMSFYGAIITAPIAAYILTSSRSTKNAFLFVSALLAAFFITNPYWLLDHTRLITDLRFYSNGKAVFQLSRLVNYTLHQLPFGTSVLFLFLTAAGTITGIAKTGKKAILLTVSALLPIVAAALLFDIEISIQTLRLIIPWIAMSCILAGLFIDYLMTCPKIKWFGYILLAAVTLELFAHSCVCAENFKIDSTLGATRLRAGRWINNNIPPGSKIGLYELPQPYAIPPMDFRKYKIYVLFKSENFEGLDYYICKTDNQKYISGKNMLIVEDFKPFDSFLGLKYSMGSTSLNTEIVIYKIVK